MKYNIICKFNKGCYPMNNYDDIEVQYFNTVKEAVRVIYTKKDFYKVRVDDVVAIFSDIKDSTKISNNKNKAQYSDVLEYFSKSFVNIHEKYGVEFIDLNGDGGIALYGGDNQINAFNAAKELNDYFKFNDYNLTISTGMAIGNLLGTKISNNTVNSINYIWAGKTINTAASISKSIKAKKKGNNKNVGISSRLFNSLSNVLKFDELRKWEYNKGTLNNDSEDVGYKSYHYLKNENN